MEEFIGILIVFIMLALMVISLFLKTNTMIVVAIIGFAIIIGLFILMIKLDKKRRLENKIGKKIDYEEDDSEEDYDEKPKKSLLQTIEESKKNKNNKNRYSDKELNEYGLENWQKDLVNKGDFEPWNFEEEDLEEDDYYYDDDDK